MTITEWDQRQNVAAWQNVNCQNADWGQTDAGSGGYRGESYQGAAMQRRHPKRKNSGGRFAMQPLKVLESPDVRGLSHATFRVLVLLTGQYNGFNNGALALSKTQAEKENISNKTLYKALATLEQLELIEKTYHASRVPPRPTMYALTWLTIDDTDWSTETRKPARIFRMPNRRASL